MIAMTPNRSAGRIEDPLWLAFLAQARERGLSNTDAMRAALRLWLGLPDNDDVPS
jgi:hypothetical protein